MTRSDQPCDCTRRHFLARVGQATAAATAAAAAAGGVALAIPDTEQGRPRRLVLGTPADFKMGTVTWLEEHELFVLRTVDGFGAFSSRCTHLGCTVRRTSAGFHCPCHGAVYDSVGRVTSGPARAPLPWFAVRPGPDGRLWADRERVIEPGTLTLLDDEATESDT